MLQMEQKDYKFEIVKVLLNGKEHVRSVAKKLSINHMMIVRKMKNLLEMNVVDFNKEGRNQVYFIKDSPEAREFVSMAEKYKLIKLLGKYPYLRDFVEKIQKDKKIKLALIFGSYAKGLVNKRSDVDIFIETLDSGIKKKYSEDSKFSVKIGRLGKNYLSKEIEKNHVILKGGEIYYDKIFN